MARTFIDPEHSADIRHRLSINIRQRREQLGLSQERLAFEAGIDRTMLSKIERRVSNPSLDTLLKIAGRLGLDIADLLQPVEAEAGTGLGNPARQLDHGGQPRSGPT